MEKKFFGEFQYSQATISVSDFGLVQEEKQQCVSQNRGLGV